eukprot:5312372-Alexandrium_andersonii.AAC.1
MGKASEAELEELLGGTGTPTQDGASDSGNSQHMPSPVAPDDVDAAIAHLLEEDGNVPSKQLEEAPKRRKKKKKHGCASASSSGAAAATQPAKPKDTMKKKPVTRRSGREKLALAMSKKAKAKKKVERSDAQTSDAKTSDAKPAKRPATTAQFSMQAWPVEVCVVHRGRSELCKGRPFRLS